MALQIADARVLEPGEDVGALAYRRWTVDLRLWLPLAAFVIILAGCFLVPTVFGLPAPSYGNLADANLPIGSPGHLLGTDHLGDDLLSRVLAGGQASIQVGLGAMLIGFLVGSNVGVLAGFFGGSTDTVVMRCLDVVLAFPALILALCVSAFLGPSIVNEIFAIAFFSVPAYARLSRAATLKIRESDFVIAARVAGAKPGYLALRHVYPNIFPSLVTIAPLTVATAMVVEASLSFLGAGIRPPQPSWGNLISTGQQYLTTTPREVLIPSVFLFATVLSLNLIGEQVRLRVAR